MTMLDAEETRGVVKPNEQMTSGDWAREITYKTLVLVGVVTMLYFFLVALDLMGGGLQVLAGDSAAGLFASVNNPVAGLTIGILVTCLVQSSSTTTSIVVSMVGSGVMGVEQATYMIFGANIGTSVTNTLVCLTFMGNRENYRRGFAAATVHDVFNLLNVALWFPLEWISDGINSGNGGLLTIMVEAMTKNFDQCDKSVDSCEKWESPIKTWTAEIADRVIQVNKDVIKDYAHGVPDREQCTDLLCDGVTSGACKTYDFKDKRCDESNLAKSGACSAGSSSAKAKFAICSVVDGAIVTNQEIMDAAVVHYNKGEVNEGGAFYPGQASAGWGVFILSIFMMIISMLIMIKLLNLLIRGRAEEWTKRALNMNGYLAILVGTGVTMLVQSSSITTSTLTPLAAIGAVSLEGMLPLTLGANIGTTFTGVLAAMVSSDGQKGFQIALVHVMFNVFGVILFYPIPRIRAIPLRAARYLGELAYVSKPLPAFYIAFTFFIIPSILLGLSLAFANGGAGGIIVGIIAILLILAGSSYAIYWYKKLDGKERIENWLEKKFVAAEAEEKAKAKLEHRPEPKGHPDPFAHDHHARVEAETDPEDNNGAVSLV